MRAFDAGWGGAVWKTIGEPIVNASSRYSSVDWNGQRMMGLNNIELITDRPIEVNLREIAEVKKRYPKHAVIASLMVESHREAWHDIVQRTEDAGADGLELNFGCPHGMSERGMGSAVGQVPEYSMHDHRVGEGGGAHARAGQADAQRHRHPRGGARRQARRGRRVLGHQHHQFDHRASTSTPSLRARTWAELRHTAATAARRSSPSRCTWCSRLPSDPEVRAADFGHRRHQRLARGGRVSPAGLLHLAGVHGGDALRLPHRGRHGRGAEQLDGREGLSLHRRFPRASRSRASRNGSTWI